LGRKKKKRAQIPTFSHRVGNPGGAAKGKAGEKPKGKKTTPKVVLKKD